MKMELFWLKQGGGQDPALLPWGPSSSTVAPEAYPEKPQNAGDLGLKTKDLVSPLIFSLRKEVRRSDMTCSELVLASGRTRTGTQGSNHSNPKFSSRYTCYFLWWHMPPSSHLTLVFIFLSVYISKNKNCCS